MKYYFNGDTLPTIPTPHDCVVKRISHVGDFLVLDFEDNICERDSVKNICPKAKSLTVKIHLVDTVEIYSEKIKKFPSFKKAYVPTDIEKLEKLVRSGSVEYLYHYVGFLGMIINLWCKTNIIMNVAADYAEFVWLF